MAAKSVKRIVPVLKQRELNYIIDYGSGTFRNTRYLQERGFKVLAVDYPEVIKRFSKTDSNHLQIIGAGTPDVLSGWNFKFDAVVCTFVMNLLDWQTNLRLAKMFKNKLRSRGVVLVEVKERRSEIIKNSLALQDLDRLFLVNDFCRLSTMRGRCSIQALYEKL